MTTYHPQAVWNKDSATLHITLNAERPFMVRGVSINRKKKNNKLSGKRKITIHVSPLETGPVEVFQMEIALRENQAKKAKIQVVEIGKPSPVAEAAVLERAAEMSYQMASGNSRSVGPRRGSVKTTDQMDED